MRVVWRGMRQAVRDGSLIWYGRCVMKTRRWSARTGLVLYGTSSHRAAPACWARPSQSQLQLDHPTASATDLCTGRASMKRQVRLSGHCQLSSANPGEGREQRQHHDVIMHTWSGIKYSPLPPPLPPRPGFDPGPRSFSTVSKIMPTDDKEFERRSEKEVTSRTSGRFAGCRSALASRTVTPMWCMVLYSTWYTRQGHRGAGFAMGN